MLRFRYVLARRDRALGIPVLARERSNESNHCNHTCRGRVDNSKPSAQPVDAGRVAGPCYAGRFSWHSSVAALSSSLLLWNRAHLEETKHWEEVRGIRTCDGPGHSFI